MDVKIVSSITRLANYMPLGSYVIYTALETYSFSLGATPSPVTTIVETPTSNYTCYYVPGASFTYTTCTEDQSSALMISLSIGFFLALFLSFLKQVPPGGKPPLADSDDDDSDDEDSSADSSNSGGADSQGQQTTTESSTQTRINGSSSATLVQRKTSASSPPSKSMTATRHKKKKKSRPPAPKYRAGIVYAEGNYYYLDFGDTHIWGHALLSFVAFGTLSLFSASVSQCLFPSIKPWIFVFVQIILLVICCFIAMFWIDDPSLSIGLMVVPQTDVQSTQTSNGTVPAYTGSPPSATTTATASPAAGTSASYNAATSTSVPMSQSPSMSPDMTTSLYPSPTSAGLANVALDSTALDAIMGQVSNNRSTAAFSVNSDRSATSTGTGVGTGAGSGAGAYIAGATIVGGSGGLGMNPGNVSRVSLFSGLGYQNQDSQVGEKGERIVESDEHEGEGPYFSVKVE